MTKAKADDGVALRPDDLLTTMHALWAVWRVGGGIQSAPVLGWLPTENGRFIPVVPDGPLAGVAYTLTSTTVQRERVLGEMTTTKS